MSKTPQKPTRRQFLKTSAALASAANVPHWFVQQSAAAEATEAQPNAEQPAIALVGCGGMGRGDAKSAARFGRVVALCDVDRARVTEVKKQFPDAAEFTDFRKVMDRQDIQVVICATVDHWHTLVSMVAMKSGKDVYCEKPLTLTIDEGKRLITTARDTKRILQTGSQQRSDSRFRLACELVRNGRIGKLRHVHVWLPAGRREGPFSPSSVPEGFDWNMWLGPTPQVEYVKERTHLTFRYWWDYSGGTVTDWGAHHHDIVLWALGMDRSGPVSIEAKPLVKMIPGGFTATSEYEINYTYANGVTQTTRSTVDDTWSGGVQNAQGQRHGIKFEGADGWLWVTRGNIEASNPEILANALPDSAEKLPVSTDHMKNFFDSVRSRQQPICDVEIGHRSATLCHLGVIGLRLGRKLRWDPVKEQFIDDKDANNWLARVMRQPWTYVSV